MKKKKKETKLLCPSCHWRGYHKEMDYSTIGSITENYCPKCGYVFGVLKT